MYLMMCWCGHNDLRMILLNLVCVYVCVLCLFYSESYTIEASVIYY
jgi:hypothetical protein